MATLHDLIENVMNGFFLHIFDAFKVLVTAQPQKKNEEMGVGCHFKNVVFVLYQLICIAHFELILFSACDHW